MYSSTARRLVTVLLVIGAVLPGTAAAYEFVPTDLEWASWPEYCRARYVTVQVGEASKWRREYSRADIDNSSSLIGDDTFVHIHHYCAGLAYLSRWRTESDPALKRTSLASANAEMTYTFTRIPDTGPLFPVVAYNLAQVHTAMGRMEEAIADVQSAINAAPTNPRAYLALALIYRDAKRLDLARDTLLQGDGMSDGGSAELHYNLGLIYFELKNMESAREYAQKAYGEGYPLPGLRQKLKRAGFEIDEQTASVE